MNQFCNATLVTCVFVVVEFWEVSDVRYRKTPSSKTWSGHAQSHFLPFPSSFDDCSSEALSLLPHFINIPVGLTHGLLGPLPLVSWGFRCLLPDFFAFSQKVDSSVCSGASPWEGRHRSCLLLDIKRDPEDLWVPPPYCSEKCPGILSQTSEWPSVPIVGLCFCSPQPGMAIASPPSAWWGMA